MTRLFCQNLAEGLVFLTTACSESHKWAKRATVLSKGSCTDPKCTRSRLSPLEMRSDLQCLHGPDKNGVYFVGYMFVFDDYFTCSELSGSRCKDAGQLEAWNTLDISKFSGSVVSLPVMLCSSVKGRYSSPTPYWQWVLFVWCVFIATVDVVWYMCVHC